MVEAGYLQNSARSPRARRNRKRTASWARWVGAVIPQQQARKVWEIRESALGAVSRVPGEPMTWEGWEDSAVAPARLGAYLRDLKKLTQTYNYGCVVYGHFGDGCTHNRITFDLESA